MWVDFELNVEFCGRLKFILELASTLSRGEERERNRGKAGKGWGKFFCVAFPISFCFS